MSEQAADDTKTTAAPASDSAPTWIGGAGLVLVAVGLLAAVTMWSQMGSDGLDAPEYTTIDKWMAVLTALIVSGLGLVTVAVAAALGRLPERR